MYKCQKGLVELENPNNVLLGSQRVVVRLVYFFCLCYINSLILFSAEPIVTEQCQPVPSL